MTNNEYCPPNRTLLAALATGLLVGGTVTLASAAQVEVSPRPEQRAVDVSIGGQPFTAYIWPDRLDKPVLFPLRTADGTLVTRGFPLDPRPGSASTTPTTSVCGSTTAT